MMIEVAAGVLCNAQGQVLVSQRSANTHLPGYWEFPGGKKENGESLQQTLQRELAEELGIEVLAAQPLITIQHDYPEKTVRLYVFDVLRWQGEARGLEGQPLRWVDQQQLDQLEMPAADKPILKALRLPGQYLITPPYKPDQQQAFLRDLEASLWAGIGVVQLRQPGWSAEQLEQLAIACYPICCEAGAQLVVNGGINLAQQDHYDGVHLHSRAVRELAADPNHTGRPISAVKLLGASCHSIEELQFAEQLDCDYVLLSPVKPTTSHTDAKALGWRQFQRLVSRCNLPVYALGGMQPEDQDQARAQGAIGVAGISGFWRRT